MEKELIDFKNWVKNTRSKGMSELISNMINDYLKSINSTRRSERRAIGSNSKAKEICPFCQSNKIHSFTLIHSKCKDCKITWTN